MSPSSFLQNMLSYITLPSFFATRWAKNGSCRWSQTTIASSTALQGARQDAALLQLEQELIEARESSDGPLINQIRFDLDQAVSSMDQFEADDSQLPIAEVATEGTTRTPYSSSETSVMTTDLVPAPKNKMCGIDTLSGKFNRPCCDCKMFFNHKDLLINHDKPGEDFEGVTMWLVCIQCMHRRDAKGFLIWKCRVVAENDEMEAILKKIQQGQLPSQDPTMPFNGNYINCEASINIREWHSVCSYQWIVFKNFNAKYARRANRMAELSQAIQEANPGISKKKARKQAANQILNFVKNYHEGYLALDEKTRTRVAEVWEKWASDRDAKVAGAMAEDLKPTLSDAAATAADHMDDINSKLSMRYVCRFIGCGFYGSNQSWASSVASGGYQFKCPKCGMQYRAHASSSALTRAQMCLEIRDFQDKPRHSASYASLERTSTGGPKLDESDNSVMIPQDDGTVNKLWLIRWPSTEDKRCIEALKAAYASMLTDVYANANINREIGIMTDFNPKLLPVPKMKKEPLAQGAINILEANQRTRNPFTWDHLLENGVYGAKLPMIGSWPVLEQEDVMRIMASTHFIISSAIDFVTLHENLSDLLRD